MKILIILTTVFATLSGYAQSHTGVVRYGELQSMGMGGPVGADYNAILLFNSRNSLYITRQDSLEGGAQNRMEMYDHGNGAKTYGNFVTNKEGFRYYHDLEKNKLLSRDIGFTYVREDIPNIDWTIHEDTKLIGSHTAKKATGSFRGREYTAWFSTEIPLPFGPWKLQGLPGLILEAYDAQKEIYWYFKSLNYPSNYGHLLTPIDKPQGKNWMDFITYRNATIEAYKEAIIGGRMVSEGAGLKGNSSGLKQDLSDTYIEAFIIPKD
ncbi:GLPGLI family protein [Salinimicrobium sp. CAU 1759]